MSHFSMYFLLAAFLFTIISAQTTMDISGKVYDVDGFALSNAAITLDSGDYRTVSRSDGKFVFPQVPNGIYVVDVYSSEFHFPSLKIKVLSENSSVSVVEYKYHGSKRLQAEYPLSISALKRIIYRIPAPSFSLWAMLSANPMMLMMLFSLVMVVAMPQLMKNLSPEELEEIQKNSLASGDPMQKLTKLMSGNQKDLDEDD